MFLSLFQLRSKEIQKVALVTVPVVIGTLVVHQICKYFKIGQTRYCKKDKKDETKSSSSIEENTFTTIHNDIEVAL
jgi:hypothetical protein